MVTLRNKWLLLPDKFYWKDEVFEILSKKNFERTEKIWNQFIKPGLKISTPFFSAGVVAETKNAQSAQTKSIILKSLTGGKISSLIDLYGNGLRLGNMWIISIKVI